MVPLPVFLMKEGAADSWSFLIALKLLSTAKIDGSPPRLRRPHHCGLILTPLALVLKLMALDPTLPFQYDLFFVFLMELMDTNLSLQNQVTALLGLQRLHQFSSRLGHCPAARSTSPQETLTFPLP